ncbi:cobalt-precorrin-5B (C(1))-methyltransferase CbiD [Desulfovibrio piger]|nr:cobalt-precorrin-5B (C(1))-methyltransferase CbiD [Desulfovibrio piger]
MNRTAPLREGFTTGSAATAAVVAALRHLLRGEQPDSVRILPPPRAELRTPLRVPVAFCASGPAPDVQALMARCPAALPEGVAHACVIKDGGDDPDATHKADIRATVALLAAPVLPPDAILLDAAPLPLYLVGGPGIGRVTLPGLPVPVGQPAVNPAPREQLCAAVRELLPSLPLPSEAAALLLVLSAPEGRAIAAHTFNPRLGIVDGISILGTQGTVRPFSHAAWQASIAQGIAVAEATACPGLGMSTGRRSEKLLMARYPGWPAQSFVQVADFAGFSLEQAGRSSLPLLVWGCFFGKAVKLAQGHASTHAKDAVLDMGRLAALCAEQGVTGADALTSCVTAAHALELLLASGPAGVRAVAAVAGEATRTASRFAGRPVRVHIFADDGSELASA